MIDVLLVDDSGRKREKILQVITEAIGEDSFKAQSVGSANEAAKLLEQVQFDLMILDVNLPLQANAEAVKDGGLRLLRQIAKGGPRFRRPKHIVGLTAYDELLSKFQAEFAGESWQLFRYDETSLEWSTSISNLLIYMSEAAETGTGAYRFDLGIITALKLIELEAVLRLRADWKEVRIPGDDTYYYSGTFVRDGINLNVVAAAAIEMGMSAASCLSMKIIEGFRPRYLAMSGITAGIGMNFGDIVIASQSWDYGSGKVFADKRDRSAFAPAPNYIQMDSGLKEKVENFVSRKRDAMARIQAEWQGNPVRTVLEARSGPVASGAAVVENQKAIDAICAHNRKVIGVEMESYGVYLAAKLARAPRPLAFSAKSVCDFGIAPKTDEFQRYAAFTSANFIYEFALAELAGQ
ncbi:MAG: hypothetical protein JWN24_3863 [Phycisphaerales bacterium]|nr:hypothetical protein [Phycisphaerales bacterium]